MSKQKRVLPILFFTLLLDMIGVGMLIPIIPILFTDPSSPSFLLAGYSVSMQYIIAGLITAIFGLMQFVASPILGELSDVFGRKRLLMLGVGILAISQLLFGFGIAIASIPLLLISRAVAGFAGANFSIAQAAIADVTEPKDRAKNFGLIGAAFGVGFILGPVLGGWVANLAGASAPFWFAGVLGVCNLLSVALFLPETKHDRVQEHNFHILKGIHNIKAAWNDKDARPAYMANFLYFAGFTFFTTFIGVLLVVKYNFSEVQVGTFFGVVGVWIVLTQMFILRILSGRFSEAAILKVAIPIVALTIFLYPLMPTVIWLYILLPVMAIPQGLSMANLSALVSKKVSAEKQGAALGINGSLIALSSGVIPLIAGVGSGLFGLTVPFMIGAVVALGAWFVLFVGPRRV